MAHVNAFPPTLENLGNKFIWHPPTFLTVIFGWARRATLEAFKHEMLLDLWGRPSLFLYPMDTNREWVYNSGVAGQGVPKIQILLALTRKIYSHNSQ